MAVQWRRHAYDQRVHPARQGKIGSRGKAAIDRGADFVGGDVIDVAALSKQRIDFVLVNIEADDGVADLDETQHQWQTDIAQPEDADPGAPVVQFRNERCSQFCVLVQCRSPP